MEKKKQFKIIIIIFLNFIFLTLGFYVFFVIYKPIIVQKFNTNQSDLLFNIYYLIYFCTWAFSVFFITSTAINLNPDSVYEGKLTWYHKFILIGFFLAIIVIILTPQNRLLLSSDWLLYFIIFLPFIILVVSHFKNILFIINIAKDKEGLKEIKEDYEKKQEHE